MMEDCIFCKIAAGEIPAAKIYEDDEVIAFIDIRPINKGHALVVPKKHHEFLWEMPTDLVAKTFTVASKLAHAVMKGVGAEGLNIGMNNGAVAGQLVPHCHVHLIPRFGNDGLRHWPGGTYDTGEIDKMAATIRSKI